VRSIYSSELGRALAKKFDTNLAKVIALAAAGSSSVAGGGKVTGIKITGAGAYSVAPTTATFSAGGGSTWTGTPITTGSSPSIKVVGITIDPNNANNYGYSSAPTITFSGGTGTAATATATIVNVRAGSTVTLDNTSGYEATAAKLLDGLYAAAQALDEKNIPSEDRACVLAPEQYYLLGRSSTDLFNRFYGSNTGSYNSVQIPEVAGFKVYKSNNLPRFGTSAVTGENNTYNGDFTQLRALCFHKAAAGTVKLRDIAVESEYQIERQGTLFVAKYAMGHGSLRPEAAVLVKNTI
jgi:hypothetical protein